MLISRTEAQAWKFFIYRRLYRDNYKTIQAYYEYLRYIDKFCNAGGISRIQLFIRKYKTFLI